MQRGNVASVMATLPSVKSWDEMGLLPLSSFFIPFFHPGTFSFFFLFHVLFCAAIFCFVIHLYHFLFFFCPSVCYTLACISCLVFLFVMWVMLCNTLCNLRSFGANKSLKTRHHVGVYTRMHICLDMYMYMYFTLANQKLSLRLLFPEGDWRTMNVEEEEGVSTCT